MSLFVKQLSGHATAIRSKPGEADRYSAPEVRDEGCRDGNSAPAEKRVSSIERTSPRATTIFSMCFQGIQTAPGEEVPLILLLATLYDPDIRVGLTRSRVQIVTTASHGRHKKEFKRLLSLSCFFKKSDGRHCFRPCVINEARKDRKRVHTEVEASFEDFKVTLNYRSVNQGWQRGYNSLAKQERA